jgi:transcriptional regulator with XRE-family HTH domain
MDSNFALSPEILRELGYILNSRQRSGWAERVSELLGVTSRTVEAWARGERVCNGPPALLIAYLARMMVEGTYSEVSVNEINQIIKNHGKKSHLNLDLPEERTKIRSLIRLHSSIAKVAEDLGINRSALSRWLSGENALGFDSISKVLDHIGLNRDMMMQYSATWIMRLDWEQCEERKEDIQNAVEVFFLDPPVCSVTQIGKLDGRTSKISASLLSGKTAVIVEISMPKKLAQHSQGLGWLLSAFSGVDFTTFYCPLQSSLNIKEGDLFGSLDAEQGQL